MRGNTLTHSVPMGAAVCLLDFLSEKRMRDEGRESFRASNVSVAMPMNASILGLT